MIGSIIGDIVGSRFEFVEKAQDGFELFDKSCKFTDDTVCTIATMDWLNDDMEGEYKDYLVKWGNKYIESGFSGNFIYWLKSSKHVPYNSYGNGAAMRVAPLGLCSRSVGHAESLARDNAVVSHSHEDASVGAKAISVAIYMSWTGSRKQDIKDMIEFMYDYDLSRPLASMIPKKFSASSKDTVPLAIKCFLESTSFEDCIRRAVLCNCDTDTVACMAGGVADAYYDVPGWMEKKALKHLPDDMRNVIKKFEKTVKKSRDKLFEIYPDLKDAIKYKKETR